MLLRIFNLISKSLGLPSLYNNISQIFIPIFFASLNEKLIFKK